MMNLCWAVVFDAGRNDKAALVEVNILIDKLEKKFKEQQQDLSPKIIDKQPV